MRTPTGCSGSTSPRAPTSRATAPTTWPPSPTRSTAAHARRSDGAPPQRCSTSPWPLRPDALQHTKLQQHRAPPQRRARDSRRCGLALRARPPRRQPRGKPHHFLDTCPHSLPSASPITPVLQRPVESGQYTAIDFTQPLDDHQVLGSIGSVGDAYDNALAESFVDSFKTELIADRVWQT